MAQTHQHRTAHLVVISATLALLFLAVPGIANAGTCTTALVEEPFLLPDGTERSSGELTLCVERQFSPVQTLHSVKLDGMPVSMAMSRHGDGGVSDSNQSAMIFSRGIDGRLFLRGYTTPDREGMAVYTLMHPTRRADAQEQARHDLDDPVILVAALTR